jgi:hypothetical protein
MSNRTLRTGGAVLACFALVGAVEAGPAFKVLYHERLELESRADVDGQQHLSFDAYGRRFDVDLEPNDDIGHAVSANRSDIKPYRGTVAGQSGSWVRLTHTRNGWRGLLSDGHELYAIDPESELAAVAVQPLADPSSSAPIMYRLADTLMPLGAGFCGTDTDESVTSGPERPTALKAFTRIAEDLSAHAPTIPTRRLVVAVVADHQFVDKIGADPEGAIVARMDIVDGIWSSEVGIRIALAPLTIFPRLQDPFSTTTVPTGLLAELRSYRGGLSAHFQSGVTHLMTGRELDGNIIGIAYLGAVCNGSSSASLSQSTGSTTMGALIAAHELGHNFSAVHDGVPGVCATVPQTYLMAPFINFSNQFSSCSLTRIDARAAAAQCLTDLAPTGARPPAPSVGNGSAATSDGGGGRLDLTLLVILGSMLVLRRVRPLLPLAAETTSDELRSNARPDHRTRRRNARGRERSLRGTRVAFGRRPY